MSKKKHKPNVLANEKLARAQHRNNFFKKIHHICNAVSGKNVFKLIPLGHLDWLYANRFHSVKVVASPGDEACHKILKDIAVIISHNLKEEKTPITNNGIEIPIDDFITAGLSFSQYLKKLDKDDFPCAADLLDSLTDFYTCPDSLEQAFNRIQSLLASMGYVFSELEKHLFRLEYTFKLVMEGAGYIQNIIELSSYEPPVKKIIIDGNVRPAHKVCWAFPDGVQQCTIKPSVLGFNGSFGNIPLDVYVQAHALNRLQERMGSDYKCMLQCQLFMSLKNVVAIRDKNNHILIEYRFSDVKAGYFRADIVDGVILIRTFLFLTNNGTPEGEKLEEIWGLNKLDKQYLAIDKLSCLMNSDSKSHAEINHLFSKAGCGCLFDLYEKIKPILAKENGTPSIQLMQRYLGLKVA
jgi:hypothetical protein